MFKFNHHQKTIKLSDEQFLLISQISNIGFVTRSQIDLLYSIIKRKPVHISHTTLTKLLNTFKVLRSISSSISYNSTGQTVYVLTRTGNHFLEHFHCFTRHSGSFRLNIHNMQTNETLIQALYAACFKSLSLGANNSALLFNPKEKFAADTLINTFKMRPQQINPIDVPTLAPIQTRINRQSLLNISLPVLRMQKLAESLLISGATRETPKSTIIASSSINQILPDQTSKHDPNSFFYNFADKTFSLKKLLRNQRTNSCQQMINKYWNLYRINLDLKLYFDNLKFRRFSNRFFSSFIVQKQYPNFVLHPSNRASLENNELQSKQQNQFFALNQADEISSFKNSTIYKPIGLLPYKVTNDFSDQILTTYSALQNTLTNNKFDIRNYDTRPFNAQFGRQVNNPKQNKQMPFEADSVISFKQGNQIKRVFIELDNRTENHKTQAQKVLNYIYYAENHPDEEILLAIVSTDGSLPTKKMKTFKYPERHLNTMADRIFHTVIGQRSGLPDGTVKIEKRSLVLDYYQKEDNLKIIFVGVSEAAGRIAEFIDNANHNAEYYLNALDLANKLSRQSNWDIIFKPVFPFKNMLNSPYFIDNGLNKYHPDIPKVIGHYYYSSDEGQLKLIQPVIAGDEYDLDTPVEVLRALSKFNKYQVLTNNQIIPPMVIYPIRERKLHAIVLPTYRNKCNWSKKFTPGQVYYYQPRLGTDNNPYLLFELRRLTQQFSKDLHRYFQTGYLTKADEKKDIQYKPDYLPLEFPEIVKKPRSFNQLHQIATKLDAKSFAKQLMLTEIPLGIYRELINRNQSAAFSVPVIYHLSYTEGNDALTVENHVDLDNCLFTANNLQTAFRYSIHFKKHPKFR